MEADDRAELEVEIDILVVLLFAVARAAAAHRRLDEAAAVIDIAAHGHAQRTVGAAIRFQRRLVSVGRAEDGKIRRQHVAGRIDLDHAFDRSARRFDHQILEARHPRLVDQRERRTTRAAGGLRPPRQQIVDLGLGQVGLDREAAVALLGQHASAELDRHRPHEEAAEIEAELAASAFVEGGLDAHIGIGVTRLAVVERGGNAVDLHIAADPVALVVGAHLEQRRLDLLSHDHALGGEVRDVEVDRVDRRSGREILLEREGERHLRGERPAAGGGIDRRAGIFAQPFHPQQFGRGRHRSVEAEAGLRRRRLGERVGHLEYAVGDGELAAGRYLHIAAADIDHRRAAGNAEADVGIANRRQACDRPDFRTVADDLDQQAVVGNRRPARFQRRPRCVGRDVQALDHAALHMCFDPGADLRCSADRPKPLHRRDRHARTRDAKHQARIVGRKVEAAGERDTEIGIAQFARIEIDALLGGVDPHPQRDAVEDERIRIHRRGGG